MMVYYKKNAFRLGVICKEIANGDREKTEKLDYDLCKTIFIFIPNLSDIRKK